MADGVFAVTVQKVDLSFESHIVVAGTGHGVSAEQDAVDYACLHVTPSGSVGTNVSLQGLVDIDAASGQFPKSLYQCVSSPSGGGGNISKNILGSVHSGQTAIDNAIQASLANAGAGSTGVSTTRLVFGIDMDAR